MARSLAVITGASRGIGAAIAKALAADHALHLIGRDLDRLHSTAKEIEAVTPGAELVCRTCDLADGDATAALCRELAALDIDALVNNAGLAHSCALARTSDDDWQRIMAVDLSAPFFLMRAIAPAMAARGRGRIVNIASTAALKGYRYTAAYAAAKAGLVGLTRAVAAEFVSQGVVCNAVCPGFVDTDIVANAIETIVGKTGRSADEARRELGKYNPQGRIVTPEEVASLVAWLIRDAPAAIHGKSLGIDGGELP